MPTLDLTLHKGFNTLVSDTLIDDNEFVDSDGFDIFIEPGVLARRLPIGSFNAMDSGVQPRIIDRYGTDLIIQASDKKIYRVNSSGTETVIIDLSSADGNTPTITAVSKFPSATRHLANLIFTNESRDGPYIYNPVLWEKTNNSKNEIIELGVDPVNSVAIDSGVNDFNNDAGNLTQSVAYKYRITYLLIDDAGNIIAEGNPFTTTDLTINTGAGGSEVQQLVGLASNTSINNKIRQMRLYRTKADEGIYYRESTRGVSNFGTPSYTIAGVGASGSLSTGNHKVRVSYYNSTTGEETVVGAAVTVDGAANTEYAINITSSNIGTDDRFDKMRFYGTKGAGASEPGFLFATTTKNESGTTTGTFTDSDATLETNAGLDITLNTSSNFYIASSIADNALVLLEPPDDNSKPVRVKYLTEYKSRIFGLNSDGNESRLYWSDVSNPHAWSAFNTADIDPDDDDEGTGLEVINSRLYVFKENSIHVIQDSGIGTYSDGGRMASIGSGGGVTTKTISGNGQLVYFVHSSGVYRFNGRQVDKISDKIENTFDFTLTTPLRYIAVYDSVKSRYIIQLGDTTGSFQLWTYEERTNSWIGPVKNIGSTVFTGLFDWPERGVIYATTLLDAPDTPGILKLEDSASTGDYNSTAILSSVTSKVYDLGGDVTIQRMDIEYEAGGDQSLDLQVKMDRKFFQSVGSFVIHSKYNKAFKNINKNCRLFQFKLSGTSVQTLKIKKISIEYAENQSRNTP